MYVLGPSHLHRDHTCILSPAQIESLFPGIILDGYKGIPNWSEHIPKLLERYQEQGHQLVWMVSDWKFNNHDYPTLLDYPRRIDAWGYPCNVSKEYMLPKVNEYLGNLSKSMIEEIVAQFPSIKLIFWCLYTRTRRSHKPSSSYPQHLQYTAIKEHFASNTIDIDLYTTPEAFCDMITDEGGHPNAKGYELLSRMLLEHSTPPQPQP